MAIAESTVLRTYKIIYSHEGNYTSINRDDNGAVSIGRIQWHADRALNLLKMIVEALGENAYVYCDPTLLEEIRTSTSWATRIVSEAEAAELRVLLGTDESISIQDELALSDIRGYLERAERLGVTDENAQIFMADIENQGGGGASERIILASEGKDIDSLYIAASKDAVFKNYMPLRDRVYYQIMGYTFADRPVSDDNTATEGSKTSDFRIDLNEILYVTGKIPQFSEDDENLRKLSAYLRTLKTELNTIIENIYTQIQKEKNNET